MASKKRTGARGSRNFKLKQWRRRSRAGGQGRHPSLTELALEARGPTTGHIRLPQASKQVSFN
jgi:hypothetical protein